MENIQSGAIGRLTVKLAKAGDEVSPTETSESKQSSDLSGRAQT